MPILLFCEECGERIVVSDEESGSDNISFTCTRCGEITVVSTNKIKDFASK